MLSKWCEDMAAKIAAQDWPDYNAWQDYMDLAKMWKSRGM